MVIIGTGGLAKDLVSCLDRDYRHEPFWFYNDQELITDFYGYEVINSFEDLKEHFRSNDNRFVSAIANPLIRYRMNNKIESIGGVLTTVTSLYNTSRFSVVEKGSIIQPDIIISSNVFIAEGTFINSGGIIGHDVKIGRYASFGPGVRILGGAEIGEFSYIGTNAVIMPGVKIGKKVRIGVGKIITEDVPDNSKIM